MARQHLSSALFEIFASFAGFLDYREKLPIVQKTCCLNLMVPVLYCAMNRFERETKRKTKNSIEKSRYKFRFTAVRFRQEAKNEIYLCRGGG